MGKQTKPSSKSRSPKVGPIEPVDLAEAARDHGVREEPITAALVTTRVVSDAQAGDATPPRAPIQPESGSDAERRLEEARQEILQLKRVLDLQQAHLLQAGKATRLNGQRELVWQMETALVRGLPRPSHIGRALYDKGALKTGDGAVYSNLYERLTKVIPCPLPENLRSHVVTIFDSSTTRAQRKSAFSALTKNLEPRRRTLVDRLGYAQSKKAGNKSSMWLTALGRKIFKGWPDWGS